MNDVVATFTKGEVNQFQKLRLLIICERKLKRVAVPTVPENTQFGHVVSIRSDATSAVTVCFLGD